MGFKIEPTIWSCDAGQQIPCFNKCQLWTITWLCNIKEGHLKTRVHDSVNLLARVWTSSCATLPSLVCEYAPTSNTTSHEKINLWVSFSFLFDYGTPLGSPLGPLSSAWETLSTYSNECI